MEGEQTADLIRAQLRRIRTAAGLSQEELGRRANYSASTISAVETGTRPLDKPYVKRMDEVLDTGGLFESLLRMAERDGQPSWFRPWLEAERNAKQLRYFNPTLVPGLLQTENYARTVLRFDDTKPEEDVERQVAARLERQEILVREHPPQVVAVIDESALRRTDATMGEQLAHLLRMAELPHVHLHAIPSYTGLHVGLSGPLALARSTDGGWVGHLENQLSGLVTDSEDEMATLLERWEGVRGLALPRDLSLALLKEVESQHGPQ
ncbi:XRE family transcriptional regulator [Micromonospora sp. KC207]|uniref:helix-turn-helix domain-containing protein n=1 Tax=Micromonospora sp. KC207 TaxID=2530377 RepID=UPI0010485B8C|nr:helix-turn-helix transcriptional regulator [Micromonospora sp. KC207]TDC57210.1 XRE family transcriptional regulator [Micromonospora sp. KC207]